MIIPFPKTKKNKTKGIPIIRGGEVKSVISFFFLFNAEKNSNPK
jgi:hypothetical protein